MVDWRNPINQSETTLWEKTRINSKTKAELCVWYQASTSDPILGTIILGHSMGKPAKGDFLKTGYAQKLVDSGYNVVLFDFNGFGESSMGNFHYHSDLIAVRNFVLQLFPKLPLYYHGVSFGSNWGIIAITKKDNPFKKVILESSPVNLPEFWIHYPTALRILKILYAIAPYYKNYANFEEHLKHTKNCDEILFISSDVDKYTPLSMAERLKKASNTEASIKVIPNSKHALAILTDKKMYLKSVLQFLEK